MTQLYAKIKRTSRRWSQRHYHVDENGKHIPFEVKIADSTQNTSQGPVRGGVGGNYHFEDVNIYVKIDDKFVRIK